MKSTRDIGYLLVSALVAFATTTSAAQEVEERKVIRVERKGADDPEIRVYKPRVKVGRRIVRKEELPSNESSRSWLGVNIDRVSPVTAAQLGLDQGTGLVVQHVVSESPAETSGIERYDILTSFGDQILVNPDQLQVLVAARAPGEKVALEVIRGGKRREIDVTLAERKAGRFIHDGIGSLEEIVIDKDGHGKPMIWDWLSETESSEKALDKLIWQGRVRDDLSPLHSRTIHLGNAITVLKDDSGTYRLKNEGGKRHLKFEDENGDVVFEGFFDDENTKSLPTGVAEKLKSLHLPEDVGIKRLMNVFESKQESDSKDVDIDIEIHEEGDL